MRTYTSLRDVLSAALRVGADRARRRDMSSKLWSDVDAYFERALGAEDPVLQAALEASRGAGLPPIQVSALQGKLLHLMAVVQGAQRILEVGTLAGYSTLWLARALPPQGRLITLELEERHAAVARGNFERAGLAERIELRVGPALQSLERLQAQGGAPFDFVFVDADKPNNLGYVRAALAMSRPGTLIVVDNVVREGAVLARPGDATAQGVRKMAEWIGREPRLAATVIQTLGSKGYDGFLLARVQS
jgi:predicted O-methyltransferase YrrM